MVGLNLTKALMHDLGLGMHASRDMYIIYLFLAANTGARYLTKEPTDLIPPGEVKSKACE